MFLGHGFYIHRCISCQYLAVLCQPFTFNSILYRAKADSNGSRKGIFFIRWDKRAVSALLAGKSGRRRTTQRAREPAHPGATGCACLVRMLVCLDCLRVAGGRAEAQAWVALSVRVRPAGRW